MCVEFEQVWVSTHFTPLNNKLGKKYTTRRTAERTFSSLLIEISGGPQIERFLYFPFLKSHIQGICRQIARILLPPWVRVSARLFVNFFGWYFATGGTPKLISVRQSSQFSVSVKGIWLIFASSLVRIEFERQILQFVRIWVTWQFARMQFACLMTAPNGSEFPLRIR